MFSDSPNHYIRTRCFVQVILVMSVDRFYTAIEPASYLTIDRVKVDCLCSCNGLNRFICIPFMPFSPLSITRDNPD